MYLDFYFRGKRDFEFLGISVSRNYTGKNKTRIASDSDRQKMALANKILLKRQLEFIDSGYKIKAKTPDFWEFMEKEAENKNHYTYKAALKLLKSFIPELRFRDINENMASEFQAYLKTKNLTNTSIHHYVNRIKILINSAVKLNYVHSNPFSQIKIVKQDTQKLTFLTHEEIELIKNLVPANKTQNDLRLAFLLGCYTGMRFSDIQLLEWSSIRDNLISFTQKKTGGMNYIPISEKAQWVLDQCDRISTYVFEKLPSLNAEIIRNLASQAGVKKNITFHVSRHTFATLAISAGADIYTVSKLLGHSSINSTQIYAHVADNVKKNIVNLL
ncbi:MAG: site-specific integrase [Bacteroidia bacterium]|nr:site-specific integrase [Bacteroidia bacterium]